MILRLAEQYLIRAESRIQNNKISSGIEDLNLLRSRARAQPIVSVPNPLPPLSPNLNKIDALDILYKERIRELFSETGHRWFDLKRTGKLNEIMEDAMKVKGGIWQTYKSLFPIPISEFRLNPNLRGQQNPGYSESF